ncbi:hypothetical protein [Flavobacterium selenitireducens]|uniref:hypothetical protein n=1 Tax=Flavobacterium selenitireducens TaxID=2722704 RepID=UPI00168B1B2E|nr:hypothetical protein [Flavobacterium selenitireducens]MBD3581481.1 hypothetical protein [Flavobacterium selenitireducens]
MAFGARRAKRAAKRPANLKKFANPRQKPKPAAQRSGAAKRLALNFLNALNGFNTIQRAKRAAKRQQIEKIRAPSAKNQNPRRSEAEPQNVQQSKKLRESAAKNQNPRRSEAEPPNAQHLTSLMPLMVLTQYSERSEPPNVQHLIFLTV